MRWKKCKRVECQLPSSTLEKQKDNESSRFEFDISNYINKRGISNFNSLPKNRRSENLGIFPKDEEKVNSCNLKRRYQ